MFGVGDCSPSFFNDDREEGGVIEMEFLMGVLLILLAAAVDQMIALLVEHPRSSFLIYSLDVKPNDSYMC